MPDDSVVLVVAGGRFSGWTSVRIQSRLDQIAISFSVSMTDIWSKGKERHIKSGDAVKVYVGKTLVVDGYIDDVRPSYNSKSQSISVSGRSKTGDLVDCGHVGKTFTGMTASQIVQELVKPYGLLVDLQVKEGAAFGGQLVLKEGQRVHQFIQQIVQMRALLVHTDAANNVVLTRAGLGGRSWEALRLGDNVLACNGSFSFRDRFSEITAIAQQQVDSYTGAEDAAIVQGSVTDDVLGERYRPDVVVLGNSADASACEQAAQWHRNTRYAKGEKATYVVNNWRLGNDKLWSINTLVPVFDHWLGIEGDRLISGVQLIIDDKGRRSEIEVVPKEAYDRLPLPEPKADAWG